MSSVSIEQCRAPHRMGRPSAEQSRTLVASVLQAAREEFAAKGFHLATMDGIAARAGVSKRTLYTRHDDKAALLLASIMDGAGKLIDYRIDASDDLRDAIRRYSLSILQELSTDYAMSMGILILREARHFPKVREALEQSENYMRRPLWMFLQSKGMTAAEADLIAKLYIAMLLGDLQNRMITGDAAPTSREIHDHAELSVEMFVPGIEARLA